MALNLSAPPQYCVDCTHARFVGNGTDPEYLRCYAPEAPVVGAMNQGKQFLSAELAEKSRPYASSMRADAEQCGADGRWFKAKEAPGG